MFVSFFQQMFLRADKAMPSAAAHGRVGGAWDGAFGTVHRDCE